MNQNQPKRSNSTRNDQYFLTMSTTRQILTTLYQRKRRYLLKNFEDEFHLLSIYKSSRWHIKLRQLERLIFDQKSIIVGSWKERFKILNLNVTVTNRDVALNKDMIDTHPLETTSIPLLLLNMPRQPQDMLLQEVIRNLENSIDF